MRRSTIVFLVLLCHAMPQALAATADHRGVESLECCVGDSEVVVVGRFVKAVVCTPVSLGDEMVTLRVVTCLKGNVTGEVSFLAFAQDGSWWQKQNTDILVCLVRASGNSGNVAGSATHPLALRPVWFSYFLKNLAAFPLDGSVATMSKKDFRVLSDAGDILSLARRVAAEPPPPAYEEIPVPADCDVSKVRSFRTDGYANYLRVPADADLEKNAVRLAHATWGGDRACGARCLRHFRSVENEQLLRSMLKDPYFFEWDYDFPLLEYTVRKRACESLTKWGVAFERPLLEERLYLRGIRHLIRDLWPALLALTAALAGLVALVWFMRQCRRHPRGLCAHCGYDLRATPDRCPECGTVPAKTP
ncbi:MAG: hypothetical protein ACHRHE_03705 [Tepidisphaerales bacterium]